MTATSFPFDLSSHQGYWLRYVSNHVSQSFARKLVPILARLADRNDAEFFDSLSPGERDALLRILRGIVERRGLSTLPLD